MVQRDPASIEEQHKAEDEIQAAAIALEISILAVIARRLSKVEHASISQVYAAMPSDIAEMRQIMQSGISNIKARASRIMSDMALDNDEWARVYYEAAQREQISAINHSAMKKALRESMETLSNGIEARCRSSVIEILDEGTGELLPIEKAYKRIVTNAATSMATGAKTGQESISKAVRQLSKSGLRVVYESGATRNLYSAVSMNVMDAYRTTMNDLRQIQGLEFGADGVEITAHALCAEDHLPYQGRQYPYSRFKMIQSVLDRPLVTGANCGHVAYPVILGVSSPAYSESELLELQRLSNKQISFTGLSGKTLTMTRYEASQYQRQIETTIRKTNQNAYLLEQAELTNFAKMERNTAKRYTYYYKRMSSDVGLSTRMERTRAYVQK